jgi:hypothetical protein
MYGATSPRVHVCVALNTGVTLTKSIVLITGNFFYLEWEHVRDFCVRMKGKFCVSIYVYKL